MPASAAARMTEVPAGTRHRTPVDGRASPSSSAFASGRAVIDFLDQRHGRVSSFSRRQALRPAPKSSGKCVSALITGIGREAAQRAERADFMSLAEIFEQREVRRRGPRRR